MLVDDEVTGVVELAAAAVGDAGVDTAQTSYCYLYCKRANRYTPLLCCRNGIPHSVIEIMSSNVYYNEIRYYADADEIITRMQSISSTEIPQLNICQRNASTKLSILAGLHTQHNVAKHLSASQHGTGVVCMTSFTVTHVFYTYGANDMAPMVTMTSDNIYNAHVRETFR